MTNDKKEKVSVEDRREWKYHPDIQAQPPQWKKLSIEIHIKARS